MEFWNKHLIQSLLNLEKLRHRKGHTSTVVEIDYRPEIQLSKMFVPLPRKLLLLQHLSTHPLNLVKLNSSSAQASPSLTSLPEPPGSQWIRICQHTCRAPANVSFPLPPPPPTAEATQSGLHKLHKHMSHPGWVDGALH